VALEFVTAVNKPATTALHANAIEALFVVIDQAAALPQATNCPLPPAFL
jgi:hypothetical protein